MLTATSVYKSLWVNNLNYLKDKIAAILENVVREEDMEKILNEDTLVNYWAVAFTHKSADVEINNSTFGVYGMEMITFAFSQYIRSKFGDQLDANKITLLVNSYINSKSLIEIGDQLGLREYIWYDPTFCHSEDFIIKAFFGCLNNIIDDKVQKLFGYICCYNLLKKLFNDIAIDLDEIKINAKRTS